MTSPGTLSQDVLDAMREWVTEQMPPAVNRREGELVPWHDDAIRALVSNWYPGGVSAFIRDHEGRGGDA